MIRYRMLPCLQSYFTASWNPKRAFYVTARLLKALRMWRHLSHRGHWWRRLQPNRSIQTNTILRGKDDVGSIVEPTPSLVWADIILADIQRVISRYLPNISTYLSCTAQRVLRTIFMQKFKPKNACLPSKIVEVWIDRFCVRYDWWRRLQLTSVSTVWSLVT